MGFAVPQGEVKFCRSQLDQKDSLVAAIEQSSAVRAKQLEAQVESHNLLVLPSIIGWLVGSF